MKQLQPVEVASSSVIARLRGTVPLRALPYSDARRLAERLASTLMDFYAIEHMPVSAAIVGGLPKIRIEIDRHMPADASGSSVWDAQTSSWVISVNGWEPRTRQRFTILHEFFHIVVHRHVERAGIFRRLSNQQVEWTADYFAGCVLAPKRELLRAWARGLQTTDVLGSYFDLSPRAIEVRLDQVHLTGNGREFAQVSPEVRS